MPFVGRCAEYCGLHHDRMLFTVRALPKAQAVLLSTGRPAGLLDLCPWYREPDAADRHKILWETPCREFGFPA